jgi:D-alanyl-D-alanine carboxypeptidase
MRGVPVQLVAPMLAGLFASVAVAAPPPSAAPVPVPRAAPVVLYAPDARTVPFRPRLTAPAYVALDADTGQVLVTRRERARLPIASLTKIMTGLLVAESGDLDRKAVVPPAAPLVEPNRDDLRAGRRYRRETLLWGTMLASANDSALTLAVDEGRGSARRFYARMNARAEELGMRDTVYASANGLDDVRNASTALDQALLLTAALRNRTFARVVRTVRHRVPWARPVVVKEYVNHNRMLTSYPGVYGGKTGWTTIAGGCLAVAAERDGRRVVAVVLRSRNIWSDMPRLLDAAFAASVPKGG